jgi:hypothetical protein
MTAALSSPDLLARLMDVLERLPAATAGPAQAEGITEAQLAQCIRAYCAQEGLPVSEDSLQQALQAHLTVHPLTAPASLVPEAPATVVSVPAPAPQPVRFLAPRGWARPRWPWTLWLRRHSPWMACKALAQGMKQSRKVASILMGVLTVGGVALAEYLIWTLMPPVRDAQPDGRPALSVTVLMFPVLGWLMFDRLLRRLIWWLGWRLGPKDVEALNEFGAFGKAELQQWQQDPEALAYVQACLHSAIPRLLVGDVRHLTRLQARLAQQRRLTQQRDQVAQALQPQSTQPSTGASSA